MSLLAAMRVVREYASTQLALEPHFHGSFLSVDRAMKGRARFGKKIGTSDVTLSSSLTMNLAADLTAGASSLATKTKLDGMVSGSLIKMPDTYLVRILNPTQRVSATGTYWHWDIDSSTPIQTTYAQGTVVTIYGLPATVLLGENGLLQVRSTTDVVPGDHVIPVHSTEAGLVEGRSVELITVGAKTVIPATTPIYSYPATIRVGLVHNLENVDTYIRADVAYSSSLIPATEINGVFLVDAVSGTTLGDDPEDVAVTLRVHRSDYSVARSYQDINKNTAIVLGATPASDLATGMVDRGRLVPMFDGSMYSVTDSDGLCGFGYDFIEKIDTGLKLRITGQTGTVIYVTTSEGESTITLGSTAHILNLIGVNTDRLIIRVVGAPADKILWRSLPVDEDCSFITYSIVSRVNQNEQWAGSGLILKPVISSLKDSYAIKNGDTFIINGGAFL